MKNMNPAVFAVFLLCAMGIWGCGQQKTGAIGAKIHELESRYAKLEEDHRALQANHDQHRKKLSQIEAERSALQQEKDELKNQLDKVTAERDAFRKQTMQRTQERDAAQSNLMQFSKELQALAGRVESLVNTNSPSFNTPVTPVSRGTD
jgi:chromosome segregation ATPase